MKCVYVDSPYLGCCGLYDHHHPATVDPCFACGRPLKANRQTAWTSDGVRVHVGPECRLQIRISGDKGYQPPKGGPRLFRALRLVRP